MSAYPVKAELKGGEGKVLFSEEYSVEALDKIAAIRFAQERLIEDVRYRNLLANRTKWSTRIEFV